MAFAAYRRNRLAVALMLAEVKTLQEKVAVVDTEKTKLEQDA